MTDLIAEIRADWEQATGGRAVAAVRVNELDPDYRVTFVGPQAIAVAGLLNSLPRLLEAVADARAAGVRAGQERMRERAAREMEACFGNGAPILAGRIRALPLEEGPCLTNSPASG